MKRFPFYISMILLLGLCLQGCRKDFIEKEEVPPESEGETVPVRLFLKAEPGDMIVVGDGPVPTKSISADVTGDEEDIRNVIVLEFIRNASGDFVLNNRKVYITDARQFTGEEVLPLPATRTDTKLLFIANTFLENREFDPGQTLEEFIDGRSLSQQKDLFGEDEDGSLHALFNGTYLIPGGINEGVRTIGEKTAPIPLKRSMAKLDIWVDNQSLLLPEDSPERVQVHSVKIFNVQDKDYFHTNFELEAGEMFPAQSSLLRVPGSGSYDWSCDTPTLTGDDGRSLYRFFVPANIRPTDKANATYFVIYATYKEGDVESFVSYTYPINPEDDNYSIRPNGHYTINITIDKKGDPNSEDTIEDLGLVDLTGEELANCYLINPPKTNDIFATYKIPVAKANAFWKDEMYSAGDRVLKSNSPIGKELYGRDLAIDEDTEWYACILWADFNYREKTSGEERVSLVDLHDLGYFDQVEGTVRGKGAELLKTGSFGVRIQGGTVGNVEVAIKRRIYNDAGTAYLDFIVWSWHLWITDYDPNQEINIDPDNYLYFVPGGKVCRMPNKIFDSGRYRNSYLMDRDLGSWYSPFEFYEYFHNEISDRLVYNNGGSNKVQKAGTGLFYQFGRKDPFPAPVSTVWHPKGAGTITMNKGSRDNTTGDRNVVLTQFSNVGSDNNRYKAGPLYYTDENYNKAAYSNGFRNVPLTVMYPMLQIWAGNNNEFWTSDDIYNPLTYDREILWNDPHFYLRNNDNVSNNLGFEKSVFDPCPPGWKLPYQEYAGLDESGNTIYNDIYDGIDEATVSGEYKYVYGMNNPENRGFMVWPNGREIPNLAVDARKWNDAIYFPNVGYLDRGGRMRWNTGYAPQTNQQLNYWSAAPRPSSGTAPALVTSRGIQYSFWLNGINTETRDGYQSSRGVYYHVRCIRNVQ